jgi:methionyl-tRNA formyltransferase
MVKVIFFGSDKYSLVALKSLSLTDDFKPVVVITTPQAFLVNQFCQEKNLPIIEWSPTSIIRIIEAIKKLSPQVGILASFGKIIPPPILELFPKGILNIHPSLLPKYRGPSPVQAAILNGDKQTGVTIIKMDNEVDHGPIVAQFTEEIKPTDTAEELYSRLFSAGTEVLKTILPTYLEGRVDFREQDHSQASWTKKLTRDNGKINWKQPDEYLERFLRAMHPWPGAWTQVQLAIPISGDRRKSVCLKRLKILKAHLENGKLVLDQVQLEGKKPVSWKQFKEGYPNVKLI